MENKYDRLAVELVLLKVDLLTRAKQNLTEKLSLHNARLNSAKAKQEEYTQKISGLQEKIQNPY